MPPCCPPSPQASAGVHRNSSCGVLSHTVLWRAGASLWSLIPPLANSPKSLVNGRQSLVNGALYKLNCNHGGSVGKFHLQSCCYFQYSEWSSDDDGNDDDDASKLMTNGLCTLTPMPSAPTPKSPVRESGFIILSLPYVLCHTHTYAQHACMCTRADKTPTTTLQVRVDRMRRQQSKVATQRKPGQPAELFQTGQPNSSTCGSGNGEPGRQTPLSRFSTLKRRTRGSTQQWCILWDGSSVNGQASAQQPGCCMHVEWVLYTRAQGGILTGGRHRVGGGHHPTPTNATAAIPDHQVP